MAAAPPAAPKARTLSTPLKLLIGFTFMIVVAVGYYMAAYSDLANAVKAAKDRYGQLQADDVAAQAAFQTYTEDSNKLEEKKAKSRELNKVLPESNEMASYLSALNQQAEIAGLKVRTVVPLDEQPQPFYTRVPVRIEVTGRFHQIAKFFSGVSRLDRIINVENIELTNPRLGDNDETTLNAVCLTTTFHANKPVGAP